MKRLESFKQERHVLDLLDTLCNLASERAEYMDAGEEQENALSRIDEAYEEIEKAIGFEDGKHAHNVHIQNGFRQTEPVLVEVRDHKGERQGFDAVILPDGRILDTAAEDDCPLLMAEVDGTWDRNWGELTLPFMTTVYQDEEKGKLALENGYLSVASPFVEVIKS